MLGKIYALYMGTICVCIKTEYNHDTIEMKSEVNNHEKMANGTDFNLNIHASSV